MSDDRKIVKWILTCGDDITEYRVVTGKMNTCPAPIDEQARAEKIEAVYEDGSTEATKLRG